MEAGGGCFTLPMQFFAFPENKLIDNVAFFVLTFSFGPYAKFWVKKNSQKSFHLRGHFLSGMGPFKLYPKNAFGALATK